MKFQWPFVRRSVYEIEREIASSAVRRGDKLLQNNNELDAENRQLRAVKKSAEHERNKLLRELAQRYHFQVPLFHVPPILIERDFNSIRNTCAYDLRIPEMYYRFVLWSGDPATEYASQIIARRMADVYAKEVYEQVVHLLKGKQ